MLQKYVPFSSSRRGPLLLFHLAQDFVGGHFAESTILQNGSCTTVQKQQPRIQEIINQQLTTLSISHVDLSTQPKDTSICHYPRNRTTTSGRIPAQSNTANSGIRSSHRIQQTQFLQPIRPRHIKASLDGLSSTLLIRCTDIRPLHLPFAPATHPSPEFLHHTISRQQVPRTSHSPFRRISDASFSSFSLFSRFATLKFGVIHTPIHPFVPQIK